MPAAPVLAAHAREVRKDPHVVVVAPAALAAAAGRPLDLPASEAYFTCFTVQRTDETIDATLDTGYGFRAKADLEARTFAWCKLNPRPIHADQEEFIRIELSRECVP